MQPTCDGSPADDQLEDRWMVDVAIASSTVRDGRCLADDAADPHSSVARCLPGKPDERRRRNDR